MLCRVDFCVGHGARNDITQHEKALKHQRAKERSKHTSGISNFIISASGGEAEQVMRYEVKMAMLIAKKNVSLSFLDDFNKCVNGLFLDSAIAKKFAMGKTKATQIIKGKHVFIKS